MSVDAHLQDIRCLVGDKLLLDVADLAKVLDRTPVAIQWLISKKKLPFAVKRIDARYQVTARSVAEWMAKEEGLLPNMPGAATEDVGQSGSNDKRRVAEARHSVVPELNPAQASTLSPYAVKILQHREESRRQFKRFIDELADADEQAFGRELFAELYFQRGELSKLYIVNHTWMALRSCRLRSRSMQYYYSDLQLAEGRTLTILTHHRHQPRPDRLVEVSLWCADTLLFKACVLEGDIRIETNIARFELYGIRAERFSSVVGRQAVWALASACRWASPARQSSNFACSSCLGSSSVAPIQRVAGRRRPAPDSPAPRAGPVPACARRPTDPIA